MLRSAFAISLGLTVFALPSTAGAASTVTGTLVGGAGHHVNAVAPSGSTASARADSRGAFTLRLGARPRGTTLHLVAPNGAYAGPVVLARRGPKAIVALAGRSVRLGRITLKRGYAVGVNVPRAGLGPATVRTDATGRPPGAGRLGLVRRSAARTAQRGPDAPAAGADLDGDGIPNAYDADDDGDLVLDTSEATASDPSAGLFTTLFLPFQKTVNANAGSTPAELDAVIAGENTFNLTFYFGRSGARSGHVDCFGLVYCRRGDGTAVIGGITESGPDLPRGARWTTYTPDGSGLPNLEPIDRRGETVLVASVQPRVGTAQMRPGDTYNVTLGTTQRSVSLAGYFVTVPALASWSSGAASGSIAYPVAEGAPGSRRGTPIELGADQVTLTFWRPQRPAIPGAESGGFRDIGGLSYGVTINAEGIRREFTCAGLYSGLSSTLTALPSRGVFSDEGATLFPLRDTAPDAAPDPANTLSFTLDLGGCLRRGGLTSAGATVDLTLTAAGADRDGGQDRAAQLVSVKLPG